LSGLDWNDMKSGVDGALKRTEIRFHGVRGAPPCEVRVLIGEQLPHQIRRPLDLGGWRSARRRSVRRHVG
jgi:hypothetical protein